MPRTDEQRAADRELTEAIERVTKAYGRPPEDIVGDYVLVYASSSMDEEGEICNSTGQVVRDNSMAGYRVLGLLTMALDVSPDDDDY